MFLGIIGAITGVAAIPMAGVAVPTAATSTAVSSAAMTQNVSNSQGQKQGEGGEEADKNDPRLAKFNLITQCTSSSSKKGQADNKIVVLREGKLYLDDPSNRRFPDGHPFSGFYLEYPFAPTKPQALVSTIKPEPPELNWIYADAKTHMLTYGPKSKSLGHVVGIWDWTEDQQNLTLEDWEGFVALEEEKDTWVLYYDRDEDHLEGTGLRDGRRVLEVSLIRKLI